MIVEKLSINIMSGFTGFKDVYMPQLPIYDSMTDEECDQVYRDYGYEKKANGVWDLREDFVPPNGMRKP